MRNICDKQECQEVTSFLHLSRDRVEGGERMVGEDRVKRSRRREELL